MNEQSLFLRALEEPDGEARRLWLERECEDLEQRTRITARIERHTEAGTVLEKTPPSSNMQDETVAPALAKPVTKSKFVDRLIRSKLMTAREIAVCESSLDSLRTAPDALSYARALVEANKLTGFQAKAIYDGRIKGLTFGEYIILDRLGKGGMGIVYRARHRRMDRLVAIKVLPRSTMATSGLVDRFYREVKAAAKLMHPNIVAALDAGEDDGLHYLVMEYVDGQDLGEVLSQTGPLEPATAVNSVIQAARGLHYAHEQGVIHRDIKPANLLIDSNGTVKVLDMGLARLTGTASDGFAEGVRSNLEKSHVTGDLTLNGEDPETLLFEHETAAVDEETRLTKAGEVMGTLAYMPPEQFADSRSVDHRGDIYSLGCTLYHLLTGLKPFPAGTFGAIFRSHRSSPIPALISVRPDIPEHLDFVFQKMLAKEPESRQSSMLQVIEELEESLALIRSCQIKSGADLPTVSSDHVTQFSPFDVESGLRIANPPQLALVRDQPFRRRKRNRMTWMPVGVAVCSLILIGVAITLQRYWHIERGSLSSNGLDHHTHVNNTSESESVVTGQDDSKGNIVGNLALNHEDGAGSVTDPNFSQDVAGTIPESNASLDELESFKPDAAVISGASGPDDGILKGITDSIVPTGNSEDAKVPTDAIVDSSIPNDNNSSTVKPSKRVGGANRNNRFGFQGAAVFGPSASYYVEFIDNGRKVSISETNTKIRVSVDDRVVEATNQEELARKDVEAFALYEKSINANKMQRVPNLSAAEFRQMQLERMRQMQPGKPNMKSLEEKDPQDKKKKGEH